jgi:RecA/RadA recombinase
MTKLSELSLPDALLLSSAISSRMAWSAAKEVLDTSAMLENAVAIWERIGEFYEAAEGLEHINVEMLEASIRACAASSKIADAQIDYLQQLPESESGDSVRLLCKQIRSRALRLAVVDALLAEKDDANSLLLQYMEHNAADTERQKTQLNLDDLCQGAADKIRILPKELDDLLNGGVHLGDTILVFGRPGAGKTLTAVNIAAGFAAQGRVVLYIGNEEGQRPITLRWLSLLGGKNLRDLDSKDAEHSKQTIAQAIERANKRGFGNVHIAYGITSIGEIAAWIDKIKPHVVVLDQLRHMSAGGSKEAGMTQNQEAAQRHFRHLANLKQFIGITIAQAGPSADGKAVLTEMDLADSKTGVQGAVDLIIGCGLTEELKRESKRVLSICRNKLSGIIGTITVFIDEQRTLIR